MKMHVLQRILLMLVTLHPAIMTSLFHYGKFLGLESVSSNGKFEQNIQNDFLCHSKTRVKRFEEACNCDEDCMRFKSCCIDFLWNSTRDESVESYTERFLNEASRYPDLLCKPVALGLPSDYRVEKLLMRSECPVGVLGDVKISCEAEETYFDVQPVLGSDGFIYKNQNCAVCNKVQNFESLQLHAKDCIRINTNSTSFTDINKGCLIGIQNASIELDSKSIRTCFKQETKPLERPQTKSQKLCRSYSGGLYQSRMCYRNFHCIGVSNLIKTTLDNVMPCYEFTPMKRIKETISIGFSDGDSYSMLVSFEDLGDKTKPRCSKGEVLDKSSGKCRKFECGFGYELIGSKCFKTKSNVVVDQDGSGDLSQAEILQRCLSNTSYLVLNRTRLDVSSLTVSHKIILNTTSIVVVSLSQTELKNVATYYKDSIIQSVESTTSQHFLTSKLYGLDFHRTFPDNRFCAKREIYKNINNYRLSSNCWLVLQNGETIPPTLFILNILRNNQTEISKCVEFHLDSPCPKREIQKYTQYTNNAVKDMEKGIVFQPKNFVPLTNGIGVCIQVNAMTSTSKGWERVTLGVEKYITIIGCFMSILCYVWVILTYSIIPALKTIPGKNIVCLCCVLLCTDVIMLVTMLKLSRQQCAVFGVFLHYFALSTQIWAGIVAFDIWSTFHGRGRGMRSVKTNKRFHIYCVIGFGVPLVVVLTCAIIELVGKVDFGYGLNGICWIAVFMPRLVTYILPMVVITMFNVTVLSYTIIMICKQSRKSKKLLKKSGGQDVSLARMAMKLIILLGALEMLGLVQIKGATMQDSRVVNSVFRIVFATARAFRGVFIWILYIVSQQVFDVYREIRSQGSLRTTTRSSYVSRRGNSTHSSVMNHSSVNHPETSKLMNS